MAPSCADLARAPRGGHVQGEDTTKNYKKTTKGQKEAWKFWKRNRTRTEEEKEKAKTKKEAKKRKMAGANARSRTNDRVDAVLDLVYERGLMGT